MAKKPNLLVIATLAVLISSVALNLSAEPLDCKTASDCVHACPQKPNFIGCVCNLQIHKCEYATEGLTEDQEKFLESQTPTTIDRKTVILPNGENLVDYSKRRGLKPPSRPSSLPEVECTFVEKINAEKIAKYFGPGDYPSFSFRKLASGEWEFVSSGAIKTLATEKLTKEIILANGKTFYRAVLSQGTVLLELSGKSPSRSGTLSEVRPPPMNTNVIGKITCH